MTYKRPTKLGLDQRIPVKPINVNEIPTKAPEIPGIPSDVFHGHPLFLEILHELKELHSAKNRDYATMENPLANFERVGQLIKKFLKPHIHPPLAACLCLMSKQIDAVYEFVGEGKSGNVENLYDKLRDVAVYTVIAMVIIKELEAAQIEEYTKHASNI